MKHRWRAYSANPNGLAAAGGLRISFELEDGSGSGLGAIESSARSAQLAAQHAPLSIASWPFVEASKAADWFCGLALGPGEGGRVDGTRRRLRSISCGPVTLLETSYGSNGRLANVWYGDGESVSYEWAGDGRASRLRSKSGQQIEVELRGDELPQSITYDGVHRFRYEYDHNANVTSVVYPDGVRVERVFGSQGDLSAVGCGPLRVQFCAGQDRAHRKSYTVHDGSTTFEFGSPKARHQIDLTMKAGSPDLSSFPIIHTLGAWRMNEQNALEEMLTPWGDRFRMAAFGPRGPEAIWTPSGLKRFDYNRGGGFAAAIDPDGSRSMLHVLEEPGRALLVNPRGVMLLELDASGRLRKALSGDGQYTFIDYTRAGKVKRVATITETFSMFRDSRELLSAIHSDCGYICKLLYGGTGKMAAIVMEGTRWSTVEDIRRILRFFWQCLGLRTIHTLTTG